MNLLTEFDNKTKPRHCDAVLTEEAISKSQQTDYFTTQRLRS